MTREQMIAWLTLEGYQLFDYTSEVWTVANVAVSWQRYKDQNDTWVGFNPSIGANRQRYVVGQPICDIVAADDVLMSLVDVAETLKS